MIVNVRQRHEDRGFPTKTGCKTLLLGPTAAGLLVLFWLANRGSLG
jgi:hypothetical protein